MKEYLTIDNGGHPFKVKIGNNKHVEVFKSTDDENEEDEIGYENKPFLSYNPVKIFIGKSPHNKMTTFSGGHGSKFDGNSILLQMNKNKYVYIGECIYSFTSFSPIIKYISPVGNSSVTYPYGMDIDNRIYLMRSKLALLDIPEQYMDDPYEYFYRKPQFNSPNVQLKPIESYMIGNRRFNILHTYLNGWTKNNLPYVILQDKSEIKLTHEMYKKLLEVYGKKFGYRTMENYSLIQERI